MRAACPYTTPESAPEALYNTSRPKPINSSTALSKVKSRRGHPTQPGVTFAREIADRVRVKVTRSAVTGKSQDAAAPEGKAAKG